MTTVFGVTSRAMRVECDNQHVVIRGLWWTKRRIPTERIIAVTSYPSVIWCSPQGRIRRKRIWFLAPNRYADPSQSMRHQMVDHITQLVRSSPGRDARKLKHLETPALTEQLRIAQTASQWNACHPRADRRGLGEYWAKHQRLLEAELARRNETAHSHSERRTTS